MILLIRLTIWTIGFFIAIAASGIPIDKLSTDVSLNAFFEKREVQIASFITSEFASKVAPTEAELDTFYKANQALFQAPEQASIEYVVLDLEFVKKSISISEADLKS